MFTLLALQCPKKVQLYTFVPEKPEKNVLNSLAISVVLTDSSLDENVARMTSATQVSFESLNSLSCSHFNAPFSYKIFFRQQMYSIYEIVYNNN